MHNTDIEKSNQRITKINGIDQSKYICCCGCHVISFVIFWSVLSIVFSATKVLSSTFSSSLTAQYFQNQSIENVSWLEPDTIDSVYSGYYMVNGVLDIILNGGVLYGIFKIKPVALLPYIIVKSFLLILFSSVIATVFIISIIWASGDTLVLSFSIIIVIMGLVDFIIEFFFIYMFWRAYKYLKEVELIRGNTIYPMQQTSTAPTYN